jgi:ankyrin repeat protein
LHDIDIYTAAGSTFHQFTVYSKSNAVPLYYAALCGFQELVEHLILKYPQHVNARGGYHVTPLVVALVGEHFQTARILYDNGADPNVRGHVESTPLHSAAWYGHLQKIQVLLGYKADVNARSEDGLTPLHYISGLPGNSVLPQLLASVARVLLEHGADVNACDNHNSTPLHQAVETERVEIVRVLLEHGASVDAEDGRGRTPFEVASDPDTIKLLSEHGGMVL